MVRYLGSSGMQISEITHGSQVENDVATRDT
jgi:hypothetical protein